MLEDINIINIMRPPRVAPNAKLFLLVIVARQDQSDSGFNRKAAKQCSILSSKMIHQ
jgi:hypothetical protein